MIDAEDMTAGALVAALTKRCYFAGRAIMDAVLRPSDLGSVQWYVLHALAERGAMGQRELVRLLEIERATLSGIIATLVRKDLVVQAADPSDQRQKTLDLTPAGRALWDRLPDLRFIRGAAFDGIDAADIATTIRVLQTAVDRLETLSKKGSST